MRLRIAPKIVICVSAVLTFDANHDASANILGRSLGRACTDVSTSRVSGWDPQAYQGAILIPSAHADGTDRVFVSQETSRMVDDRPLSPRLATLQDRLKSGDRGALDSFWKEITESGAPIIEGAPGNDREVLVTMLWRAKEETKNVFVFRLGDVSKPMARLLDTDLWYQTFRLQKGASFIYQFATNLPDPKEWRGVTQFAGAVQNDPLNPIQFADHPNELNPYEGNVFSAVELPSAEPQSWIVARPKVPTGRIQRDKFRSKLLGNERPIWIYTPHGYAAGKKPYALLVLTDGGTYVNTARIATAPGKYTYRFLVDGVGLVDPNNPATEDDGQGHTDSVIVIKPK
jgi:Domain of unknown function (DUF3327)